MLYIGVLRVRRLGFWMYSTPFGLSRVNHTDRLPERAARAARRDRQTVAR